MVRMLTAYTLEADDAEFALSEILEQLDLENRGLQHRVGILFCHPDFIETETAQKIAEALPFDVMGSATVCNLAPGLDALTGLSVSVLTSDTVSFTTAAHPGAVEPQDVEQLYEDCQKGRKEAPALLLTLMSGGEADAVVNQLSELSGGETPIFGTNTTQNNFDPEFSATIYNGEVWKEGPIFLMAWGELEVSFYVTEISKDLIQKQQAVVTSSEGAIIKTINHLSVPDYLETIGISREMAMGNLTSVPFIFDFRDDTMPVARVMRSLTPEGYAHIAGRIPEGSTLALGTLDKDDIARLIGEALDYSRSLDGERCLFLFPCVSHFWAAMEENHTQLIREKMGEDMPYHVYYAGGEICPVFDGKGRMFNRFHNFTCIACILK